MPALPASPSELQHFSHEHQAIRLQKYATSPMYADIVEALKGEPLSHLSRQQRRSINHKMRNYKICEANEDLLLWKERNGMWARCLVEEEIDPIFKHYHDQLGHFSPALTLGRLVGEFYWPTRARDIETGDQAARPANSASKNPGAGVQRAFNPFSQWT